MSYSTLTVGRKKVRFVNTFKYFPDNIVHISNSILLYKWFFKHLNIYTIVISKEIGTYLKVSNIKFVQTSLV